MTLGQHLDASALFARIGGEEFAALLTAPDAQAAQATFDAMRLALSRKALTWAGQSIVLTVSIGVAELTGRSTIEDCLHHADAALYRAKRVRNSLEFAMADATESRLSA